MTGNDAATPAERLGGQEGTLVYRRTTDERPCTEVELNLAMLHGWTIKWLAAPKEVLGEGGKVTALVCSVMELGVADSSGRRAPVETEY